MIVAGAAPDRTADAREKALADYPRLLRQEYGGYYTLGRLFVKLIGHPEIMRLCTQHGLKHPLLMKVDADDAVQPARPPRRRAGRPVGERTGEGGARRLSRTT